MNDWSPNSKVDRSLEPARCESTKRALPIYNYFW
jgi:hypothetical protein